jgi:hypothetical protein
MHLGASEAGTAHQEQANTALEQASSHPQAAQGFGKRIWRQWASGGRGGGWGGYREAAQDLGEAHALADLPR